MVVAGYVIFFFAPTNTMLFIGIAGVLLFVGQAFIQLLMLMFLADTIEYGFWKFGRRNAASHFPSSPLSTKWGRRGRGRGEHHHHFFRNQRCEERGGCNQPGLVYDENVHDDFSSPMYPGRILTVFEKIKIDKNMYEQILKDLAKRGDIRTGGSI